MICPQYFLPLHVVFSFKIHGLAKKLVGNLFWQIGGFESNTPKFQPLKNSQCDVIIIAKSPAARRARQIVGMEFTIESCIWEHHFSKEFYTLEVGEELVWLSTRGR